jgi:hypothetical protein
MIEKLSEMKGQLSELATVLNKFSSEAVQLRLLDLVFGKKESTADPLSSEPVKAPRKASLRKASKAKKQADAHPEKRKKGSTGTGAVAALVQLASTNFFDKPKTINDIIEHCKQHLARTYKANEFSGKLGRLVRTKDLTRAKNADKQYEYKKP